MQNEEKKTLTQSQKWKLANATLTEINKLMSELPMPQFLEYLEFFHEVKERLLLKKSLKLMPLCDGKKENICDAPKSKINDSFPESRKAISGRNLYSEEMASLPVGQASLPEEIRSLKIIETSDSEDVVSLPQGLASLPKDQASLYRNDLNSKIPRSRQKNNRIINIAETVEDFAMKRRETRINKLDATVASLP